MSEFPEGWVPTTVKALAGTSGLFVDGDWVESKDQDPNGDIRLLQLADIGDGSFLDKSDRWINEDAFERLRCTELATGDVLIARMPDPLGRACLMPTLEQRCVTVVDVAALRVDPLVADNRWGMHIINAPQMREEISAQASGTTRRRISRGNLGSLQVPLPPLAEQKRIADKLDTVLTRVDAVNTRLARVAPILKRFRQSVLTAATSGRLTEDWRGGIQSDWQQKQLQAICQSIADGDHQAPPQATSGVPFVTISALSGGRLDLKKASRFVPESYFVALDDKRRPRHGDVLFSVTGSIGIPALVATAEPFTFQRHIAILKPDVRQVSSSFLRLTLESSHVYKQALAVATGTAQMTIPLGGLRRIEVLLPSSEEQAEIVRRVEILFAFADRLEARLLTAQAAANRLTPSVLAKAFRGELVPQDPSDEPASALLQRLAANTEAPAAQRGRRKATAAKV